MLDDTMTETSAPPEQAEGRFERARLIGFLSDAASEEAVREGLSNALPEGLDIRRGGIKAAVPALKKMPTPHVLIVDLSGEAQPLTALGKLSDVVEPNVRVLVIGESRDVDFYRQVTRGLGVAEYMAKPLTRDGVARHFLPCLTGQSTDAEGVNGGRVVSITGACGGVGATTIAANLAWHFAAESRRHTALLDPDLHMGKAAMMLDVKAGPGLRTALEAPERIDNLFVERAAQPVRSAAVGDRLHILAGEERLEMQPSYGVDAAPRLLEELRRRYNLIVADVPFAPVPLYRGLLDNVHQRVVVLEPTLGGIRDALRLIGMARGPLQSRRPVVVLNRVGRPGALSRKQVEDSLKMTVDVAIPDLPRQLGQAATLGEPAVTSRGPFRAGIAELARQVAFIRLLDSDAPDAVLGAQQNRKMFWRKSR